MVGEAGSQGEALRLACVRQPDFIFVADDATAASAAPLLVAVRQSYSAARFVIAAATYDAQSWLADAEAGAVGFILWQTVDSCEQLRLILDAILTAGCSVASPTVADALLDAARQRTATWAGAAQPLHVGELTEREAEVWELLAHGYNNQQIADDLTLSPTTVATHMRGVLRKLDVASRHDAARLFWQHHIVVPVRSLGQKP